MIGRQAVFREGVHQQRNDPVIGGPAGHQLDRIDERRHHEMGVQHPGRVSDLFDEFGGREGRGIAGQDRIRRRQAVQIGEDRAFQVELFRHRLDHQPGVAERVFQCRCANDPTGLAVRGRVDLLGQIVIGEGHALGAGIFVRVGNPHLGALRRQHQRDAAAKGAGTDDGDGAGFDIRGNRDGHLKFLSCSITTG